MTSVASRPAAVTAQRLMRAMEKLDAQFRACWIRHLFGGLLIMIATVGVLAFAVHRIGAYARAIRHYAPHTVIASPTQTGQFIAIGCISFFVVGLIVSGIYRWQKMTLSQTVDAAIEQGLRASSHTHPVGSAVMMAILTLVTSGGWLVWEGVARRHAQRRCARVDPVRLAALMIPLHKHPAGLGTSLVFKPNEPEAQLRDLLGYLLLHDLAAFDRSCVWLTRRGHILVSRAGHEGG